GKTGQDSPGLWVSLSCLALPCSVLPGYPSAHADTGTPVVGRQAASPAPAELPGLGHLGCPQRLPQAAYDLVCSPQGPPGGHDQHGLSGAPGGATVSRRVAFVTAR